ncbi:hypothetical protein KCU81_g417, partial [Aureobasidium melanogenum]
MIGITFFIGLFAGLGLVHAQPTVPSSSLCPTANGRTVYGNNGAGYLAISSHLDWTYWLKSEMLDYPSSSPNVISAVRVYNATNSADAPTWCCLALSKQCRTFNNNSDVQQALLSSPISCDI